MKNKIIYPEDALVGRSDIDIIEPDEAKTLYGLFSIRAQRTPDALAYQQFENEQWNKYTYKQMLNDINRWQQSFKFSGLQTGDRIAILLKNSRHWVCFDMAAHALGLVVVPLYVEDRAENMAYIMEMTQSMLLLVDNAAHWMELKQDKTQELQALKTIITIQNFDSCDDDRVKAMSSWLSDEVGELQPEPIESETLASIIFTSGTTGKPKGVMLSHRNMLENAYGCLKSVAVTPKDSFISFLPLSHTFERTVGYYAIVMAGAQVIYARSIPELGDDLIYHAPTGLITVPRIFERIYQKIKLKLDQGSAIKKTLFELAVKTGWAKFEYRQGRGNWHPSFLLLPLLDKLVAAKVRQRLGGRLRFTICGGAPLPSVVAKTFVGLGIEIIQGYGLTESSPVLCCSTLSRNNPISIGLPLSNVKIRIAEDGELQAQGPNVMLGYWQNEQATKDTFTADDWLKTGDIARVDDNGFFHITGRIKEILVLSNGEKVPPADMESAIAEDPLFLQSMVIGEGKPYLSAIVVLNKEVWQDQAQKLSVDGENESDLNSQTLQKFIVERIAKQIDDFPGYAQIYKIHATLEPWTVENGLLTPTLKLKRPVIFDHYKNQIAQLYKGH